MYKPYEGFAPFGAAVWNNVQEKVDVINVLVLSYVGVVI